MVYAVRFTNGCVNISCKQAHAEMTVSTNRGVTPAVEITFTHSHNIYIYVLFVIVEIPKRQSCTQLVLHLLRLYGNTCCVAPYDFLFAVFWTFVCCSVNGNDKGRHVWPSSVVCRICNGFAQPHHICCKYIALCTYVMCERESNRYNAFRLPITYVNDI